MSWKDMQNYEDQRLAENRASAQGWLNPSDPMSPPSSPGAGYVQPTTEPVGLLEYLSQMLNLKPTPQRSSLYDENAPISMEPIKEASLRNYTGEDYARGRHVGAESRGNQEPYYPTAYGIPSNPREWGIGGSWTMPDAPLESPGPPPSMDVTEKGNFPGVEPRFGDELTGVLAAISLGTIPMALRSVAGLGGIPKEAIMDVLGKRGVTEANLAEMVPGLAKKLQGDTGWSQSLLGGSSVNQKSLSGFAGGLTRKTNKALRETLYKLGRSFEPTPQSVGQTLVGQKTTKSLAPYELNQQGKDGSGETLWGTLQRLKGMGSEGLQSMQTPVRNIANTWGPDPETQKWLYDYVVRQRGPWNQ